MALKCRLIVRTLLPLVALHPVVNTAVQLQSDVSSQFRNSSIEFNADQELHESAFSPFGQLRDRIFGIRRRGNGGQTVFRQKLKNAFDVQYTAKINIGGQELATVLDTGSFELLVFAERCKACGGTSGLYRDEPSKTFTDLGFVGEHSFGSGTTWSTEALERIEIGPYVSARQHFWEVVDADMPILEDGIFHAILGMGPPSSRVTFAKMNAESIHEDFDKYWASQGDRVPQKVKDEVQHFDEAVERTKNAMSMVEALNINTVSVCLGRAPGSPGYFVWNDASMHKEKTRFIKTKSVGDIYWSAELTNVKFGNTGEDLDNSRPLSCGKRGHCSAVIDTGTSLIVAPHKVIAEVEGLLSNWTDPTGDCSDLSGLPDLHFDLNGESFSLPPQSYVGKVTGSIDVNIQRLMPQLRDRASSFGVQSSKKTCVPLLMAADADSQFGQLWILGMPFFREYYTSFHFKDNSAKGGSMGFAVADGGCRPSEPRNPSLRVHGSRLKRGPFDIDASKIRSPSLLRKAASLHIRPQTLFELEASKAANPFIHI